MFTINLCFTAVVIVCLIDVSCCEKKVNIERFFKAFKDIDVDGDHKVTLQEVADHLVKTDVAKSDAKPVDLARSIFEYYDKNGDGIVELQEFLPRHDEL